MRTRWIPMRAAKQVVADLHRHNAAPVGGIVAQAAFDDGRLCGVAFLGRPVARLLDSGLEAEITRVATDGTPNACSLLYGAMARVGRALGLRAVCTYTLASEPGTSLRAAGFVPVAEVDGEPSWDRPSRQRAMTRLPGLEEDKVRWERRWEP